MLVTCTDVEPSACLSPELLQVCILQNHINKLQLRILFHNFTLCFGLQNALCSYEACPFLLSPTPIIF